MHRGYSHDSNGLNAKLLTYRQSIKRLTMSKCYLYDTVESNIRRFTSRQCASEFRGPQFSRVYPHDINV